MLERLAHIVIRRRWYFIAAWIALTMLGAYSAQAVSTRWLEEFSIPGYSAYEANQRTLETFGTGAQPPHVIVLSAQGDVTKNTAIEQAIDGVAAQFPDFRVASYYSTGSRAYVSDDRRTTFATFYPPGQQGFDAETFTGEIRDAFAAAVPPGVDVHLTGRDALYESEGGDSDGPSVLTEALIGGLGATIILLFVFGTLPAVVMPILMAIVSILNTFTLIWVLTYITSVSLIVQFLVALVGLGVAIDYALLMIFRFRDELRHGADTETALVETMTHAGRAVIVSGSTVAIGLFSMVLLPVPVIRSIGIGGLLIPIVSVLRRDHVPARDAGAARAADQLRPRDAEAHRRGYRRGARVLVALVALRHAAPVADRRHRRCHRGAADDPGGAAQRERGAGKGPRRPGDRGRRHRASATDRRRHHTRRHQAVRGAHRAQRIARGCRDSRRAPRLHGRPRRRSRAATRLAARRNPARGGLSVRGFGARGPPAARSTTCKVTCCPRSSASSEAATRLTLGGTAPEDRDFVHAVYGKFPLVLAFVILLTLVLLMRAFRSVFLSVKAVILNLLSLGAAFGIIVFIFQQGHGSEAIWNVHATDAIISWIPLMIFAFLYGLSMDYEVFMVSRMREAYDETGDTKSAIALGLARTGKLVTSAALVLMFAFFVLSTSPGVDVKQFGIGLAAGIIFDATVIRALLVPSIMHVAGDWNWWLPAWAGKVLRVRATPRPVLEKSD